MSKQITRNIDFISRPSPEEIEIAMGLMKVRAAAKRRQRISKFRKHIPTIYALQVAGNSLRETCDLLRELHSFEGSASGLSRFIQSYPLLQPKSRQRSFRGSD